MKKIIIILLFTFFSSSVFAEFIMQPVNCTTKKTSNCGAYIYNTKSGEVYFCDSEECKEVKTPIEIFVEYEDDEENSESSIIPKKKESKIPKKPKKKESKIPKKPKKSESKDDKCKKSKIPKPGCTKKTSN